MSSSKEPGTGVSRRGFIRDVGLGTGAIGTGILEKAATAEQAGNVAGPGAVPITLQVNGKPQKLTLEPRVTLLDALREHLDLTGAKKVCDRGNCGACTVLLDGKAVYSCSVLAIDAQGKQIQTIESLTGEGKPKDALIAAFVENDGLQCGFCTPGFMMASHALLARNPKPTPEQVQEGLSGNLCRCGTYMGLRRAVLQAAKQPKGGRNA
ncbi:MAG TPA: (2Fe-2S)-binding protein [Bryobacteraceae bacterium]